MTLMHMLRSRQKLVTWLILMPVVIAFTMFGLGVSLSAIFTSENVDVIFEIEGVGITRAKYDQTQRVWGRIGKRDVPDDEVREILGEVILAEKCGFTATEAEVDVTLADMVPTQEQYDSVLSSYGLTDQDIRLWRYQALLREKYSNLQRNFLLPSPTDVYSKFLYDRTNYTLRFAQIELKDFAEDVQKDEEKLKAFYDTAAQKWTSLIEKRIALNKLKNSYDADQAQLKALEKEVPELEEDEVIKKCDIVRGPFANLRVVYVPYEDVKKDITIDPMSDEVKESYYSNIAKYRRDDIPEAPMYGPMAPKVEETDLGVGLNPSAPKPTTPPAPETPEDALDNDGAPVEEAAVQPEPEQKTLAWEDWDGTEFKSIDEVREQVIAELINEKAILKAEEVLTEVRNLIVEMEQEKFDFNIVNPILEKKLGGKFPFKLETLRVAKQDAEIIETFGSTDLKIKAFDEFSYWKHWSDELSDTFSSIITVTGGKYMFFVENEETAVVKDFESAKADVETAWTHLEQKRLAKERAEEIIAALKSGRTVADLSASVPWQTDSGNKSNLNFLREFGEGPFTVGMICDKPIWIEDQRITCWRVQMVERVDLPTVESFATEFDRYKSLAETDSKGARPDQPKGVLGAWQRYDKKLFGIKEEEEEKAEE